MRTLLISFFALVIGFGMAVPEAEAKRLGGGSSLGKSFFTPKKAKPVAPTQQKATTGTSAATQKGQPRRSGFGGMMAGLLAGGLLGALFFGGAFDGIQFMDILLIGLLIFVAIKLFSGMKKAQAPQYAGHQPDRGAQQHRQPHTEQQAPQPFQQPEPSPAAGAGAGFSFGESELQLPQWFNEAAFVEGAKQHFNHLQTAWDNEDWAEIATYTTPDLLEVLQQERAKQPANQKTEVVSVMAELANFTDNGDHVVATINFYGWLREDGNETSEFSELWHLSRDMSQPDADWMIVGIQQH